MRTLLLYLNVKALENDGRSLTLDLTMVRQQFIGNDGNAKFWVVFSISTNSDKFTDMPRLKLGRTAIIPQVQRCFLSAVNQQLSPAIP